MRTILYLILGFSIGFYFFYLGNRSVDLTSKMLRSVYLVGCQEGLDRYEFCKESWEKGLGSR